ncbi:MULTISPECIES: T9SS sorting signal type C domain-containing protein [unclassified Lacinutrix]
MKKITYLLMLFSIAAFSQNTEDANWRSIYGNNDASFYEIQADFNAYWKGKTPERGQGYKPFKRWEDYMAPRVYPSGDINLPSNNYNNYISWLKEKGNSKEEITYRSSLSNWTEIGPIGAAGGPSPYTTTGAGRTNFVRFDPSDNNIMYVGTPDGGLWKSTNGGASYTTNTDFLAAIGCSDLVIDPTDTDIMYLATGDLEGNRKTIGVLKSTDGGATWNTTSFAVAPSNGYLISKLVMDPNNPLKMIASTNVGTFNTNDGWATYFYGTFPAGDPNLQDMELKPGSSSTVYASGTNFYKSTDFGVNWTEVTSGLPTSGIVRIALGVTPGNDSYVYALYANSAGNNYNGMYLSTDSGTTFTTQSTSPNLLGYEADGSDAGGQAFYDLSIVVSPTNPNIVTTGGVNHWQSTDGGVNWVNTTVWDSGEIHADVHELYYLPGSATTMFSCNDGGLFKSTDNGNDWYDISGNMGIGQMVKLGLSPLTATTMVAGEQDNGSILKTNSSWYAINGGDGGECFIDYTDNNTIYTQYVEGKYARTYDGGTNMNPIVTGLPTGIDFYSPFKMDPVDNYTIYSGGTPTLYISTNQGDNWYPLATSLGTGSITDFVVAPSNTAVIYTVQADAISKSTDYGVSFTNVTGTLPTTAAFSSVTVSNTNPDKVWVTYSGYEAGTKVYQSLDGGSNWTSISAGLPNIPMNTIVYTNNTTSDAIYVGGDIGVYYFNNTLSAFELFNIGLPNTSIKDLEIHYATAKIVAGTYGRGAWISNLNDATLDVNQNEVAFEIKVFENENEQLKVKSTTHTINSITVFDALGRRVFDQVNIGAKEFTIASIKRKQQALFVNVTLSNNSIICKKIMF